MESTSTNTEEENSLVTDYLAAYHEVKFSGDNDPADTFRILMAMKYHVARRESDELAMQLMDHALDEYSTLMEEHGHYSTNNPDFEKKIVLESGIKHIDDISQFIKPLPCQTDNSKSCTDIDLTDRDIEDLMEYWNGKKESPRRRKVSQGRVQDVQNAKSSFSAASSSRTAAVTAPSATTAESILKKHEKRQQFANLYQKYSKFNKHPYNEDYNEDLRDERRQEKSQQFTNSHQRSSKFNRNQYDEEENDDLQKDRRNLVPFKSAKELNSQQKSYKKTLGGKPSANSQYVNPFKREKEKEDKQPEKSTDIEDERLKNIDPKMIELITNEIMDSGALVTWDDVAGLQDAKRIIKEIIVFPMLRPDIFTGLRRPPKGMLLFGPPGTGKTLIGKCIASQSKSTFFSISASSLTSKWVGEGEKMVRALFAVARVHQPSVIFIDEIDSLLTQRSETEHESSRRIKTEFLVQLDGATTGDEDRILVIGATNRPQELDEAARRRFVKRLYVPLPEFEARRQIVENLLANERHELTNEDIDKIAAMSENYSGADMTNLCKEASMGPIRSISFEQLENIRKEDVRCVTAEDFENALCLVRPSVSQADLGVYVQWDATYGSGTAENKSK